MNIYLLLAIVAVVFLVYACKPSAPIVIPDNPYLVDVRTAKEFDGGSVSGAINIPLDQIETRMAELKGKNNLVVFCRSGNRSGQAKDILEKNGFANIVNGGGWKALKKQISKDR